MSSKRIFAITVNYAELFQRCPKEQLHNLQRVQNLAKSYVEKVNSLPETPPKIDWEYYKMNVRPDYLPMVEEFEKKYTEFQVPYPEDLYKEEFARLTKEVEEDIKVYKQKSNVNIAYYECMACKLLDVIPFEEMTMEDYAENFPDYALDPLNRPTFWPHTADEQLKPAELPPVPVKAQTDQPNASESKENVSSVDKTKESETAEKKTKADQSKSDDSKK